MTFKYHLQAGVDIPVIESMPGNCDFIVAALRGAARAYDCGEWGVHVAMHCYGGSDVCDRQWLQRWRVAIQHAYISGATFIYPESGHFAKGRHDFHSREMKEPCARFAPRALAILDYSHAPRGLPRNAYRLCPRPVRRPSRPLEQVCLGTVSRGEEVAAGPARMGLESRRQVIPQGGLVDPRGPRRARFLGPSAGRPVRHRARRGPRQDPQALQVPRVPRMEYDDRRPLRQAQGVCSRRRTPGHGDAPPQHRS